MSFTLAFTARPEDIDELGHVNNAGWISWVQTRSVAHWQAGAPVEHHAAHVGVVTRHEADYRGNLRLGEQATGETWVPDPPKGARFARHWRFTGAGGKVLVEGVSTWALLDRASGRLLRIRPEFAAPFR